jgi:hypothetical protein
MRRIIRSLLVAVVATGVLASPPTEALADEEWAAAGFTYAIRHKILGGEPMLETFSSSALTCATYCSSHAACVAFNYFEAPADPTGASCVLLGSISGSTPAEAVTSGARIGRDEPTSFLYGAVRGTDEPGVDRPGSDYSQIRLTRRVVRRLGIAPALTGFARDAAACSQLCDRDATCRAMSVVRAGVQHPRFAVCYLKKDVPGAIPNPDVHSSVKLGPPPT